MDEFTEQALRDDLRLLRIEINQMLELLYMIREDVEAWRRQMEYQMEYMETAIAAWRALYEQKPKKRRWWQF